MRLDSGAALALALVAGCAGTQGTVVLLPDPGGRDTAVVVSQENGTLTLDKPYAAAHLTRRGPAAFVADAGSIEAQFGAARAALPAAPQRFTLYFVEGRDDLTDASRQDLESVLSSIAARPVPDVLVVGHTDTVAGDAVNDPLSRQRAEFVRRALIGRGVAPENIVAAGRGKREPIVPTADGVAEPRNRRVEILVR